MVELELLWLKALGIIDVLLRTFNDHSTDAGADKIPRIQTITAQSTGAN